MATHTPAPWNVGGVDGAIWIERPNTAEAVICDIVQSGLDGIEPVYTDEDEANARLIAAAPELLAALTAAHGYLLNAKIDVETGVKKATALDTINGGLQIVRAAIAKAEGR